MLNHFGESWKQSSTRMHSSRMRTPRSSGRPVGSPPGTLPPEQTPPDQAPPCCKACWDTTCNACWDSTPCCKACWDTTCNACWDTTTCPHPRGQNHRRLWKYNLAPTLLRAVKIDETVWPYTASSAINETIVTNNHGYRWSNNSQIRR